MDVGCDEVENPGSGGCSSPPISGVRTQNAKASDDTDNIIGLSVGVAVVILCIVAIIIWAFLKREKVDRQTSPEDPRMPSKGKSTGKKPVKSNSNNSNPNNTAPVHKKNEQSRKILPTNPSNKHAIPAKGKPFNKHLGSEKEYEDVASTKPNKPETKQQDEITAHVPELRPETDEGGYESIPFGPNVTEGIQPVTQGEPVAPVHVPEEREDPRMASKGEFTGKKPDKTNSNNSNPNNNKNGGDNPLENHTYTALIHQNNEQNRKKKNGTNSGKPAIPAKGKPKHLGSEKEYEDVASTKPTKSAPVHIPEEREDPRMPRKGEFTGKKPDKTISNNSNPNNNKNGGNNPLDNHMYTGLIHQKNEQKRKKKKPAIPAKGKAFNKHLGSEKEYEDVASTKPNKPATEQQDEITAHVPELRPETDEGGYESIPFGPNVTEGIQPVTQGEPVAPVHIPEERAEKAEEDYEIIRHSQISSEPTDTNGSKRNVLNESVTTQRVPEETSEDEYEDVRNSKMLGIRPPKRRSVDTSVAILPLALQEDQPAVHVPEEREEDPYEKIPASKVLSMRQRFQQS